MKMELCVQQHCAVQCESACSGTMHVMELFGSGMHPESALSEAVLCAILCTFYSFERVLGECTHSVSVQFPSA
jgi:hypothetical protein